MRSTEANCPMAQVRVFSSGFGSGETEEEDPIVDDGGICQHKGHFKEHIRIQNLTL